MLYRFNDENLDLQKFLDVLNSYASSFGMTQRDWKLPFTLQVSNSKTWKQNYYKSIEFIVRRSFFLGEKNEGLPKI